MIAHNSKYERKIFLKLINVSNALNNKLANYNYFSRSEQLQLENI